MFRGPYRSEEQESTGGRVRRNSSPTSASGGVHRGNGELPCPCDPRQPGIMQEVPEVVGVRPEHDPRSATVCWGRPLSGHRADEEFAFNVPRPRLRRGPRRLTDNGKSAGSCREVIGGGSYS
ncbi:hypothetical protein ACWGDX_12620 [Streptomyces sp. NPDC055025]